MRLRSVILGKYEGWNPEVAMRYLALLSELGDGPVTEVGSGDLGIIPYLKRPIVGVDPGVSAGHHAWLRPVKASVLRLPFRSRSQPTVVCTDMLEHIAPPIEPRLSASSCGSPVAG